MHKKKKHSKQNENAFFLSISPNQNVKLAAVYSYCPSKINHLEASREKRLTSVKVMRRLEVDDQLDPRVMEEVASGVTLGEDADDDAGE